MKKLLLGIFLLVTCAISMGSDRRECNTELIMANTQGVLVVYNVKWLDHDMEKYKGKYVQRCKGELQPYTMNIVNKSKFRLCPGRHIVIWHKQGHPDVYNQYKFQITKDMIQIVLTPEKMEILKI